TDRRRQYELGGIAPGAANSSAGTQSGRCLIMMTQRISMIAGREFTATVSSKGFLVGLLLVPAILGLSFVLGPRVFNSRGPNIVGQVAVSDSTASVTSELRAALTPEAI